MTNKITLSRELVGNLLKALQVFTGHDSGPNLRHTYGNEWWEPIDAMREELRAALASQHVVCSAGILCQNRECKECGGNGSYIPPLAEPVLPAGGEPVYEVQWNSIHGPEGWKVVDAEEYARCEGPLWDRRITHNAEVPRFNVCVSCGGRFAQLKTCSNAMMGHGYYVECASCGAKTSGYDKAASAAKEWNGEV